MAMMALEVRDEACAGELLRRLMHAQLERENGGRQAWLCVPTPARMREILLAMAEREGGADA